MLFASFESPVIIYTSSVNLPHFYGSLHLNLQLEVNKVHIILLVLSGGLFPSWLPRWLLI